MRNGAETATSDEDRILRGISISIEHIHLLSFLYSLRSRCCFVVAVAVLLCRCISIGIIGLARVHSNGAAVEYACALYTALTAQQSILHSIRHSSLLFSSSVQYKT